MSMLLATAPATTVLRPPIRVHSTSEVAARSVTETPRARATRTAVTTRPHVDVADATDEQVILPPPASFGDAPAATAGPTPLALRAAASSSSAVTKQGGVWAVMIGIDDYPGSRSDLRASVADANEMDAALAKYGVPADRRLVLRNGQATAANISASLRWLTDHAASDAIAVFFYAGHIRKLGGGTEALVGADGQIVTDDAMAAQLRPLSAWRTWIALAACYAGGFDEVLAPGRILTGAADANSLAYESSAYGHSYMVEYMVHRAMNLGQAPASVEQSFAWAADALRRDHPNRVPVQFDDLQGELELGPSHQAPPPAPQQPKPAPSGGGGSQPPPSKEQPKDPPDDGACVISVGSLVGCDG